jgi:hypothetical protein
MCGDIDISDNLLTGSLPSEIGQLEILEGINLSKLHSTPEPWSYRTSFFLTLTILSPLIGNNKLSGSLPSEIGLLTTVESVYLNNNIFTGQIPSEVGNMLSCEVFNLRKYNS